MMKFLTRRRNSKLRLPQGAWPTGRLQCSRRTSPGGAPCLRPPSRRGMTTPLGPWCLGSSSLSSSDHVRLPSLSKLVFLPCYIAQWLVACYFTMHTLFTQRH